jgi:hypothetical protein
MIPYQSSPTSGLIESINPPLQHPQGPQHPKRQILNDLKHPCISQFILFLRVKNNIPQKLLNLIVILIDVVDLSHKIIEFGEDRDDRYCKMIYWKLELE